MTQAPTDSAFPVRAVFFSDALAERNGTGAYYHDLLPKLAANGVCPRIYQTDADDKPRLLSMRMPGDRQQILAVPPIIAINRSLRQLQPHVIVVVTPGLFGLYGVWVARRRRLPLLAAFHTDFERLAVMYWTPLPRRFFATILRWANQRVCRAADCVLVNNEELLPVVRRLGARSTQVIGTPLPGECLPLPRAIPDTLTRVCFAGRMAPEKNIGRIIDAAAELPDIEFFLVGDGPLRGELGARASGLANVRFTGWLARPALISVLDSCSLLLLPSEFETFGSVALEALARGRPALVSSAAGICAWDELRGGVLQLEADMDLAQRLRDLAKALPEEWRARASAARLAAIALNDVTVTMWANMLRDPMKMPTDRQQGDAKVTS